MKINKKKILADLKTDWKASETAQKDWMAVVDTYKRETYGLPYGNEQKGKSAIVSKDIKKQLEWMIPSIVDPFLSTTEVIKCNPITFEDTDGARQTELVLNTQFCRKFPRYNFVNKAVRVLATEGTVVVQTGWDYEGEEVESEQEVVVTDDYGDEFIEVQTVTETIVKKNQPTATVCRNEDIYLDPTCMDDFDKCQFIIHRYETDLSTLKSDGRYKNLDKIDMEGRGDDPDFDAEDDTEFGFSDKARQKILVYEYWGNYDIDGDDIVEPIVCAWVGNTIIRLEDNPYPDNKPPFIVVPFNPIPFQMTGEALAENIGDNQKVKTAVTRGVIDNMAKSNNGQIGVRRGSLSPSERKKWLAGKNFEFNGTPNDFWQGSYNQIPGTAFDVLAMQTNEIESQTGVKSFSGGISGNSLGSTATAARGAMDATSMRRLSLVRNVAENLIKPLMRKWMAYNSEFLEDEEIVRVTNAEFVPVRRDDLGGNIDIDISISTAEDNAAKSQELSFLLQTLGNSMPFDMTQLVIAEIAKLSRMPLLEKQIREYEQKPDPMAEQMHQIEMQKLLLENKKLQSEIDRNLARAGEDEVDIELKRNKAAVEAAKAGKLMSEKDKLDLDFIKTDEQVDETFKAEEKQLDRRHQLAMAEFQKRAGDKNIGMVR